MADSLVAIANSGQDPAMPTFLCITCRAALLSQAALGRAAYFHAFLHSRVNPVGRVTWQSLFGE